VSFQGMFLAYFMQFAVNIVQGKII